MRHNTTLLMVNFLEHSYLTHLIQQRSQHIKQWGRVEKQMDKKPKQNRPTAKLNETKKSNLFCEKK